MAGYRDIIGHEQIIEYFKGAIEADKVSHAYILNGEDFSGKMMLAESFAMALQCEKHGSEPCMECQSCKQTIHRNQPDIKYVTHEKPNTLGVEDIRKQINDDIVMKPYSSRYKIYIIEDAEKMNEQAENALLKTIEEPPEYAIIMLLTNNADAFLPTILSRCVRLDIKAVPDETIRNFLMKEKQIPDYQADLCVAFAQGNVGKAIRLSESERFNEMREQMMQLMRRLEEIEPYEMTMAVKQIAEYKLAISDYFDLMMVWFRDILLYKASADANGLVFKDQVYEIKKQADKRSYEGIEKCLEALDKAKSRLKANVNFDLTIEMLLWTIKEN
ncbi:MAG: DNA polymerase III subunit delta [Lachnospiraceae bacterium]|nr:DNA polymerase III subunit delta [Lachnospiraceae bacterium]